MKKENQLADQIAFIGGQVHALINTVNALIATHPDKPLISQALQAAEIASEARVVPSPVPEAFLQGVRDAHAKIAEAARRFQEPG